MTTTKAATPVATVKQWENPLWTIAEVARSLADLGFIGVVALPAALVLMAIGGTSVCSATCSRSTQSASSRS